MAEVASEKLDVLYSVSFFTEVCRMVEGAKAEVYTVAIVLVYTDSHNTMANLVTTV
jgi:hypothetical protein